MTKKQRSTTPSRKRYEKAKPVISLRVPKELHDRMLVAKEKEGMSYTDILKAGLGMFEVKIRAEEEVRQDAYDEGQLNGYELAESVYKVTFPCKACGKPITVEDEATKEAIKGYMLEHGWVCGDCLNRRF
jgi:hypothetical protein